MFWVILPVLYTYKNTLSISSCNSTQDYSVQGMCTFRLQKYIGCPLMMFIKISANQYYQLFYYSLYEIIERNFLLNLSWKLDWLNYFYCNILNGGNLVTFSKNCKCSIDFM